MPQQNSNSIIFEQPLNEHMRICLRLERLFDELNENLIDAEPSHSQIALSAIMKINEVINRPDIKSKLTQTLTQHNTSLKALRHIPQVDSQRLNEIIDRIEEYLNYLNQVRKINEAARDNDFLNQLRLQMCSPGGIAPYKVPAYMLWLQRSNQQRISDLTTWSEGLTDLQSIVTLILNLTRSSAIPQRVTCEKGMLQKDLDPSSPFELIRIALPKHVDVYPEFSVGKHRLNVRFLLPNYHVKGRATQFEKDIEFELNCCRIYEPATTTA